MNRTTGLLALVLLAAAAASAAAETPPATAAAQAPASQASKKQSGTMDRLELDSTTITGNRELPKVMYVVPWKRAGIGDLGGRPLGSLVDEVLAPVDREVFGREINYFRALEPSREAGAETPVTAGQRQP